MSMKRKGKRSFQPDDIATSVSKALRRDLWGEDPDRVIKLVYDDYVNPADLYIDRQVTEFLKKYKSSAQDEKALEKEAFAKFRNVASHIDSTNRLLASPDALPSPSERISRHTSRLNRILLRARSLVNEVLGHFSHEEWFAECKHSAGTSLGLKFSNTNLEDKCKLPLSTTKRLEPLLHYYLAYDWQLKNAVMAYNQTVPYGPAWVDVVEGSRSTTVDKDDRSRRLIAIEPTVNMFFQQGLMAMMVKRLERFGLDFSVLQDKHRRLAWESSITGSNATIDWTSASDCSAITFIEWLLPPVWVEVLKLVRCDVTLLDGETMHLPMLSTMGNATTFPVETLVFWALGVAACSLRDETNSVLVNPRYKRHYVSVFGDDCILPRWAVEDFLHAAHYVGYLLNDEKSFSSPGQGFRESCGGDYHRGRNVRPFYLKGPHSTKWSSLEPWLYIMFNRLKTKYIMHFGTLSYVYDKALWTLMSSVFLKYDISVKVVPESYPDDSGLKISGDFQRFKRLFHPKQKFSTVLVDRNGSAVFNFCKFNYRQKEDVCGDLRLWRKLKSWYQHSEDPDSDPLVKPKILYPECQNLAPQWYVKKRIGGYVVGKGKAYWPTPS